MVDMTVDLGVAEEVGICDIEEQLRELQTKILTWVADKSLTWDKIPSQASDFLRDVNEVWEINEVLELLNLSNRDDKHTKLLDFAESILQMAMARLEDEFAELLARCYQPLEPGSMSFAPTADDSVEKLSSGSFDEEFDDGAHNNDVVTREPDVVIDSIQHELVPHILSIAKLMFLSNYEKECYQAYIMIRKNALEECLSVLQMEKFNIDDVYKMKWNVLSWMMKKWNQAMHIFIRVCVARERHLCDLVFKESPGSTRESCFLDISKSSILHVLSIAVAIAISPPMPEKLFQILDTYEYFSALLVDMEQLFSEGYGDCILIECHEVLLRLKESVNRTLQEFKNKIHSNKSSKSFPGGGVHPLTKYVMNYIRTLTVYGETLNLILDDPQNVTGRQSSQSEDGDREACLNQSPMSWHLKTVTKILEANLDRKAQLYNDGSLRYIFMMNNAYYMVEKVRDSDLRIFFGHEWIRAHIRKFQMHERDYERTSWSSVLYFLREEGIFRPNSSNPSMTVLKERFRSFNHAFEEVYKAQTAWVVPKDVLREDLRISLSTNLIQAYRMFEGRYASHLNGERRREKYIKYKPDDLQKLLLDLFGGSPKSLQSGPRRWIES